MAKKAKGIAPSYFQQLLPEAKKRYQEKIRIISGIDPFTLSLASARHGQSNNPAALPCPLPPIDSTVPAIIVGVTNELYYNVTI